MQAIQTEDYEVEGEFQAEWFYEALLKKIAYEYGDACLNKFGPSSSRQKFGKALVITETGMFYIHEYTCDQIGDEFFAIGSGADFAMGAMYCGKPADSAVDVATKLSITCAGPVRTGMYKIKT